MPFSNGTYSLPTNSFAQPVSGQTISSTDATSTWADFVTAFSTCMLKDGTQTVTANIPMAGFKLTGVGAATASGDALAQDKQSNGLLDISGASGGQIKFPASQNSSANANTLDDYEENTWTPAVSFATAGNLSIAYTTQVGSYTKVGREVTLRAVIVTSTFTHTTASGDMQISGIPFAHVTATGLVSAGVVEAWGGITKAGYTDISAQITSGSNIITFVASSSAAAPSTVAAADMPTGGTVQFNINIQYQAAT